MASVLRDAHRLDFEVSGEQLIARYRHTRDPRVRERAIECYMPLARRLAHRYHRGPAQLDDLVQVAYLGLVKAVDRFDPGRGVRFGNFAIPTITGELRRYFRDTSWMLHVPRGVQEAALEITNATRELTHRLGRAPTIAELSGVTGLDAEQIIEALHARAVQDTASLEQPRGEGGDATIAEVVGREDERIDLIDHWVTVAPLVQALPERERKVLYLRFAQDLTQSEIAERMGCSQMQISRLLRRSMARLNQDDDTTPPGGPSRLSGRGPGKPVADARGDHRNHRERRDERAGRAA
jgi:RNA polymerase sigma-B factor